MKGLAPQQNSKLSKMEVFGDKKASAKAGAGEEVAIGQEGKFSNLGSNDFASLFAALTEKNKNASELGNAKSEIGEAKNAKSDVLKNIKILETKTQSKEEPETKNSIENKSELLNEIIESTESEKSQIKMSLPFDKKQNAVTEKVAKTSNNLEQLLNGLKDKSITKDSADLKVNVKEGTEASNEINPQEKHQQVKNDLNLKSNLNEKNSLSLLLGEKNVRIPEQNQKTELNSNEGLDKNFETKKVTTGEDYLKNIEFTERKGESKLTLLNDNVELPKKNIQNLKGYSSGPSLLSEPLIKSTKDFTVSEAKLEKKTNPKSDLDKILSPEKKMETDFLPTKQVMISEVQNDKNNHGQLPDSEKQINQKVLDLSKINTANTTEIIKRISDYVEQNQVANRNSLDLTVKHESLGEFKIQVSKMPNLAMNQTQGLVDMQITTSSKEGHDFFVKNEVSLMKNLNQAGINLSDLRIISSTSESTPFGQSDSKQSSFFGQNSDGSEKQFTSFESSNFLSDSNKGSERRKELWEEYQQRYGA